MENKAMSMPEVKPEIVFIFELLNEVRAGKLRIPKFQRSYVWRRQQMTELLDSINLQYPIGSLLVWETEEQVSSRNWIGPLTVPTVTSGLAAHVLDGQQRLSTLTGVLMASSDSGDDRNDDQDPGRWRIWFNIQDNNFEHPKSSDSKPEPWHFPMWKLLDTVSFLEESQRILQDNVADGAAYVKRVQDLLRRFQSYKVPVIRIKNTGLNQAVEIFARLNSKGQPMSADEMVSALSYREDQTSKPLSEHINDILEGLDGYGFGEIDRVIILRSLLAILKEDIYRTDWTRFTDSKRSELRDKLPAAVGQTQAALVRSAEFLHSLGVYNHRLLPYAMQLVVLSVFFEACQEPTPEQRKFLERWFWVSSFTGWFASGNPSRWERLLKEFREHVANDPSPVLLENMRFDEPAQAFPKVFDMRSARARTLLLMVLAQHPRNEQGQVIDRPWDSISEHGPRAIGYIAATVKDKALYSSPANRILRLEADTYVQAKNWLVELGNGQNDALVLESHAIPAEALPCLRNGDADGFLKQRQEYLVQLERDFMQMKGVVPPLDREVRPAAIDTE
jgi:hypothetical protein